MIRKRTEYPIHTCIAFLGMLLSVVISNAQLPNPAELSPEEIATHGFTEITSVTSIRDSSSTETFPINSTGEYLVTVYNNDGYPVEESLYEDFRKSLREEAVWRKSWTYNESMQVVQHKNDRATSHLNFNGYLFKYTYDSLGRMATKMEVSEYGTMVGRKEFVYNEKGNQIKVLRFDRSDKLTITDSICYDELGNKIALWQDDPMVGFKLFREWTYDQEGREKEATRYNPHLYLQLGKRTLTYDASDRVIKAEDVRNITYYSNVTEFRYNEFGKLASSKVADLEGKTLSNSTYSYHDSGLLFSVVKVDHRKGTIKETRYMYN